MREGYESRVSEIGPIVLRAHDCAIASRILVYGWSAMVYLTKFRKT